MINSEQIPLSVLYILQVCNESQPKTVFKRAPVSAPVENLGKVSEICAHITPRLVEDLDSLSWRCPRLVGQQCHRYLYMCVGELLSRTVGEPFDIGIGPGSVIVATLMASSLIS
jgi:hypothetical protein